MNPTDTPKSIVAVLNIRDEIILPVNLADRLRLRPPEIDEKSVGIAAEVNG